MFNFPLPPRDSPQTDPNATQLPWVPSGMPDGRTMPVSFNQQPSLQDIMLPASQLAPNVSVPQSNPQFDHINAVLNQLAQNRQSQNNDGLIQQILSQRNVTGNDTSRSILNSNLTGTYESPEDIATQRTINNLSPYSTVAKIQNAGTEAQGGATGALVNRIMQQNGGDLMGAIQYLKGGANQGTMMSNGQISAIPGAADAKGIINRGAQAGTNQANLDYAAPIETAKTTAQKTAENTATNQVNLPKIQDSANYVQRLVGELVSDPALPESVGIGSYVPVIRGSARANFMAKLGQLQSQAFLEAFNNLRGGGQISNVEGDKATSAINRMSTTQDEKGFRDAANDFLQIVNKAVKRSKNAASGNQQNSAPEQNSDPLGIR